MRDQPCLVCGESYGERECCSLSIRTLKAEAKLTKSEARALKAEAERDEVAKVLPRLVLMAQSIQKSCELNNLPSTSGAAFTLAKELDALRAEIGKGK